jgi:hypothetical protein
VIGICWRNCRASAADGDTANARESEMGFEGRVIVVEVNKQYRQDGAWFLLLWGDCVDDDARGSCSGNWHMNLSREEQTTLAHPG